MNPQLPEKALAALWNPLPHPLERAIKLPLYYTGLTAAARVRERDAESQVFPLARDSSIRVPVQIPARGFTWLVIE